MRVFTDARELADQIEAVLADADAPSVTAADTVGEAAERKGEPWGACRSWCTRRVGSPLGRPASMGY